MQDSAEMLRNYMMEERRHLKERVASIERALGIDSKEKQLERRIQQLEERLKSFADIANSSLSVVR
jgi:hypothetical protein